MSAAFVKCSVCGLLTYPRKDGTPRAHVEPYGDVPESRRPDCPGSGKPGTPVERTVAR